MLLRLVYMSVTNAFALLRLLPASDRDKDAGILALRHQITVLQRQLGANRPRFSPADRAFLAALLLHRLTYRRTGHVNLHVRGYKEEGTTTTPFDMVMMNDLDRFHLVMDVID